MGLRFADLTYSDKELEQDAIRYLKEQVYEPSYAGKVKAFVAEDVADFKQNFDDEENIFLNLFYDEYRSSGQGRRQQYHPGAYCLSQGRGQERRSSGHRQGKPAVQGILEEERLPGDKRGR